MNRRKFVAAATMPLMSAGGVLRGQRRIQVTEQQKGDPGAMYETLTYDRSAIAGMVTTQDRARFERWDDSLIAETLTTAKNMVDFGREKTPDKVAALLELFGLPFQTPQGYVPFCAAGVSYCALLTYFRFLNPSVQSVSSVQLQAELRILMPDLDHYSFYPTVSCVDMYHIAMGRHRWMDVNLTRRPVPRAGWIVLFDWSKSGRPEHCGLVLSATTSSISTIEFNTSGSNGDQRNGGVVALKERDYRFIRGFVVTGQGPRAANRK